jgi:protein gp37
VSAKTGIEWTDATWNPLRGCSRVSEGCRHCYAEQVAYRFSGPGQPYEGLVRINAAGERVPEWSGVVKLVEKHLLDPLRWKEPRRIFVNSMSDLFHPNVPDEWIDRIFAVMALCPQHEFQVLTKRPERMLAYLSREGLWFRIQLASERLAFGTKWSVDRAAHRRGDFLDHVWLGVSVEDQKTADERIPLLLQTPAAVRFISAEPLLGPLDIAPWLIRLPLAAGAARLTGGVAFEIADRVLDWAIGGGESGREARPMHPDWARSLRDQCQAAGVPFFFKQWGEWKPAERGDPDFLHPNGGMRQDGSVTRWPDGPGFDNPLWSIRVGKHAAGALLDGREWREFPSPEVRA